MSVKAQALVWDLDCPAEVNGKKFRPNHKYVLVCYADHADHWGKNIWPAVPTIAKKTGYEERSVQRLTHDLENMGLLVADGLGPRGTNKWKLPFSEGGDRLSPLALMGGGDTESPLTESQGDSSADSLGDSASGDSASGDSVSPELKGTEPLDILINKDIGLIWGDLKEKLRPTMGKASFETWLSPTQAYVFEERTLIVLAVNSYACNWLTKNIKQQAEQALGIFVKFITLADVEDE